MNREYKDFVEFVHSKYFAIKHRHADDDCTRSNADLALALGENTSKRLDYRTSGRCRFAGSRGLRCSKKDRRAMAGSRNERCEKKLKIILDF